MRVMMCTVYKGDGGGGGDDDNDKNNNNNGAGQYGKLHSITLIDRSSFFYNSLHLFFLFLILFLTVL